MILQLGMRLYLDPRSVHNFMHRLGICENQKETIDYNIVHALI